MHTCELTPLLALIQDAPFFAEKLRVRMLPCVIMFRQGVAVDRIVGFDGVEKPKSAGEDVSIELVGVGLALAEFYRRMKFGSIV